MNRILVIFVICAFFSCRSDANPAETRADNRDNASWSPTISSEDNLLDTSGQKWESRPITTRIDVSKNQPEISKAHPAGNKQEKSVSSINPEEEPHRPIAENDGKRQDEKPEPATSQPEKTNDPEKINDPQDNLETHEKPKIQSNSKDSGSLDSMGNLEEETVLDIHQATVSHDIWDALLKKYVSNDGMVNYRGLKGERNRLDEYLKELSENVADASWGKAEQMAYWINAYNAFTVDLILDNYPLKSIIDLDNGKTWDVKRIRLGDKDYSLNQIEHDIIRPRFKDPRIHFAVNCAARSCPPLLNAAWTSSNLEQNLERMTRLFIRSDHNTIGSRSLELSRIFDWYRQDFGNVTTFIDRYTEIKIRPDAKISYREYDWSLNGK